MNAARRKELDRIGGILEAAFNDIAAVGEAEQEAFDSLPDSLQEAEKSQRMEEVACELENMATELQDITERLLSCQEA